MKGGLDHSPGSRTRPRSGTPASQRIDRQAQGVNPEAVPSRSHDPASPIIHHHSSIIHPDAFTLIELLVVIAVLVLLMALLLPALSRARKQARAVVCQGRLRQFGLLCAVYAHEDAGAEQGTLADGTVRAGLGIWHILWRSRMITDPALRLCPSADRPVDGDPVPWGGTHHSFPLGALAPPPMESHVIGYASYGVNGWTYPNPGGQWNVPPWRSVDVKGASRIPAFFDCAMPEGAIHHLDPPPEYEYAQAPDCRYPDIVSVVCMDRHHAGVNMLMLDWSVRKVGLKELWTLQWHRDYDTAGPWTKAGGVTAADWPEWMWKFKDY